MKRFLIVILVFCFMFSTAYARSIEEITASSFILMDGKSGTVLLEKNSLAPMPPASITKIMTMLLLMEAVDSGKANLNDVVTVSETAAFHEGSHVFLEKGEQISVSDLLKAVAVASGNDAAIAIAEYISGTQEAFVQLMNEKAKALGLENTNFVNCNGLDAENHYSCAKDIAKLTFELAKHTTIFSYTTIWMDTLRNGAFQLANTNKLIRFYDGATGMKTGSTSKAGYCLSATAERNTVSLIAVVMNAQSSKERFADASALLNWGFENYRSVEACKSGDIIGECSVHNGILTQIAAVAETDVTATVLQTESDKIIEKIDLPTEISAPIHAGDKVGTIKYYVGNREVGCSNLIAYEGSERISFFYIIKNLLTQYIQT